MATSQQIRSQTKLTQWSDIFPNEQVTETQSALFVKKLLAVAVSSISYLRALFPENAFGDRCLEDVNLKILRDDPACPEARRVIQWMRGCFDALEKKYLRAVLVGIYEDPEDPDTVLEQYSFKFAYGDGSGIDIYRNGAQIASAKSDNETRKATKRLLRTIVLLSQTLCPLPDDVMMTMKLLYYDEVTPEDYNPPGFKDCNCDDFYFKDDPLNIKVGDVATQFHSFKLRVKTKNHDLEEDQEEITTVPQNEDELLETNEQLNDSISLYQNENQEPNNNKENEAPKESGEEKQASNTRVSTPASSVVPDEEQSPEMVAKCPCGVHEDDGLMILCADCNTWQHATCFAILKPEQAPETHFCVECAQKSSDIECTDKSLAMDYDSTKIQAICLWRRTLLAVSETTRIMAPNLSKRLGVPLAVAASLLKRLESEGFVKTGGKAKRFGKLVQKNEIINRGFDKYFRNIDEDNNKEIEDIGIISEKASKMEISSCTDEVSPSPVKKGSKRKSGEVVSLKNKDLRFQISDSQPSPSSDTSTKKRRKRASVSAEPMCV